MFKAEYLTDRARSARSEPDSNRTIRNAAFHAILNFDLPGSICGQLEVLQVEVTSPAEPIAHKRGVTDQHQVIWMVLLYKRGGDPIVRGHRNVVLSPVDVVSQTTVWVSSP